MAEVTTPSMPTKPEGGVQQWAVVCDDYGREYIVAMTSIEQRPLTREELNYAVWAARHYTETAAKLERLTENRDHVLADYARVIAERDALLTRNKEMKEALEKVRSWFAIEAEYTHRKHHSITAKVMVDNIVTALKDTQ